MEEDIATKKRKKYVTEKSAHVDSLLIAAREFQFQYKPVSINLNKDIDELKKLTQDCCIRPDLYLDNDDTCIACKLFDNCACKLKNLGKQRRR